MDNKAGSQDGVPMVFYPNGTSWRTASVAIYTRPISSSSARPNATRVSEQVDKVIQMYREGAESIKAVRLQEVRSNAGAPGELWQYTGYSNGGAELAVYFPAANTVNFFVMQVPELGSLGNFLPALIELAESYREDVNCKPCSEMGACMKN
jgi:hypothetical protein